MSRGKVRHQAQNHTMNVRTPRKRGRPPGSKNKAARDSESTLEPQAAKDISKEQGSTKRDDQQNASLAPPERHDDQQQAAKGFVKEDFKLRDGHQSITPAGRHYDE
ncbi:MAG: hypothetical protein L6R35_002941 [Caloplaca aegaea]|nr:MAG: hypothetical protein L6R35_002941 [Caloplaca aegaea]